MSNSFVSSSPSRWISLPLLPSPLSRRSNRARTLPPLPPSSSINQSPPERSQPSPRPLRPSSSPLEIAPSSKQALEAPGSRGAWRRGRARPSPSGAYKRASRASPDLTSSFTAHHYPSLAPHLSRGAPPCSGLPPRPPSGLAQIRGARALPLRPTTTTDLPLHPRTYHATHSFLWSHEPSSPSSPSPPSAAASAALASVLLGVRAVEGRMQRSSLSSRVTPAPPEVAGDGQTSAGAGDSLCSANGHRGRRKEREEREGASAGPTHQRASRSAPPRHAG